MIAIIDDDDSFRAALVELLGSLDYDTLDFASAEAFVASQASGTVDCIISDIHMPGMSGFDLKRLLASRQSRIPVIMITARSEPGLEARSSASGVICLLRKPFESNALIACLETAFAEK